MDGDSYTEAYTNTAQNSATPQYFDLPGIIARYAKLFCVDNYGDSFYVRVNEFELYGYVLQDDAGSGSDAGDTFDQATSISLSSYSGYAHESHDYYDWYRFNATLGRIIEVTMTPPTGWNYNLYLYDPLGNMTANSTSYGDATEHILYKINSTGEWRIAIYASEGQGEYSFTITLKNAMHVENIDFSTDWTGNTEYLYVTVTIMDQNNATVEHSSVYGTLTLPDSTNQTYSDQTNHHGTVTFEYSVRNSPLPSGTYTFTVTNVEKDDWIYDFDANKETSDSYTT